MKRGPQPKTLSEAFDGKWMPEPNSGCWLWTAAVDPSGYGRMNAYQGNPSLAHRASWLLRHGTLSNDLQVCHRCDNPSCVNPDHLFLGDQKANMQDCKQKGRTRSGAMAGELRPTAKIKDQDVYAIRRSSQPQRVLAQAYGVSQKLIFNIKNRKAWRHLPDEAERINVAIAAQRRGFAVP